MWQQVCLRWHVTQTKISTNFKHICVSVKLTILERGSRLNVLTSMANHFIQICYFRCALTCATLFFFLQSCEILCIWSAGIAEGKLYQMIFFIQDDSCLSEWFRHLWSEQVMDNKITKWGMMCFTFEIALCGCGKLICLCTLCYVWVLVHLSYCVCRRCVHPWRKGPSFHPPVGCSGLWNCAPWSPYGSSPAGRLWVSYSCSLVSYSQI